MIIKIGWPLWVLFFKNSQKKILYSRYIHLLSATIQTSPAHLTSEYALHI